MVFLKVVAVAVVASITIDIGTYCVKKVSKNINTGKTVFGKEKKNTTFRKGRIILGSNDFSIC